jgi:hypothetical protein
MPAMYLFNFVKLLLWVIFKGWSWRNSLFHLYCHQNNIILFEQRHLSCCFSILKMTLKMMLKMMLKMCWNKSRQIEKQWATQCVILATFVILLSKPTINLVQVTVTHWTIDRVSVSSWIASYSICNLLNLWASGMKCLWYNAI